MVRAGSPVSPISAAPGSADSGEGTATPRTLCSSRASGRIKAETSAGGSPAIVPTIRGRAWITGFRHYVLDATDPYPQGYVVADTWGVPGKTSQ